MVGTVTPQPVRAKVRESREFSSPEVDRRVFAVSAHHRASRRASDEFSATSARVASSFPEAHANASADPLIETIKKLELRCECKVARPATNVAV